MSDKIKQINGVKYERRSIQRDKSFLFAVACVNLCKQLIEIKKEYILSKQLLRAGTSIGANIREAQNTESRNDFIHKMSISQKECDETIYWLELLFATNYITEQEFNESAGHASELLKRSKVPFSLQNHFSRNLTSNSSLITHISSLTTIFVITKMQKMDFDYIIIGSGIVGLAIARDLIGRFPGANISILEKEPDVAYHSSGRNSGVLHAGFYYSKDSLKAKFTRDGNRQMTEYCLTNNLRINQCKKVVVAKDESELSALFELDKRGKDNGVEVKLIDEKQLAAIDPNVKTFKHALYSPNTATVDPVEVNRAIRKELEKKGVQFFFNEAYLSRLDGNSIRTSKGNVFSSAKIINAAGLYADKVARDFGYSDKYTIIPFKGVYLKYHGKVNPVSLNVYPVPVLRNPWLGVHFTVTVDGTVKIGPTSMPAFWRENYNGCDNFSLKEAGAILGWESVLFLTNAFNFRNIAFDEIKKYRKSYFASLAEKMVKSMDAKGFNEWGRPGIRAQLLNKHTKELVMDFVVEGDKNSIHVLNAVSPAFTCSFPFAKWVVDNYIL